MAPLSRMCRCSTVKLALPVPQRLPGGGACRSRMKLEVKVSFADISCIQVLRGILHSGFLYL